MKKFITIQRIQVYLNNMKNFYQGSRRFTDLPTLKCGEYPRFPAALVVDTATIALAESVTVDAFIEKVTHDYEAFELSLFAYQQLGDESVPYIREVIEHYEDLLLFAEGNLANTFCTY